MMMLLEFARAHFNLPIQIFATDVWLKSRSWPRRVPGFLKAQVRHVSPE